MPLTLTQLRTAAHTARLASTPSIVPRANPATRHLEVPPGIAPVRAFRPGTDTVGSVHLDVVSGRAILIGAATLA